MNLSILAAETRSAMKRGAYWGAGIGAILGALVAVCTGFQWPWELLVAIIFWVQMVGCIALIIGGYLGVIFSADSSRATAIRGALWGSGLGMFLGLLGGSLLAWLGVGIGGSPVSYAIVFVMIATLLATLTSGFIGATIGALVGFLKSRYRKVD